MRLNLFIISLLGLLLSGCAHVLPEPTEKVLLSSQVAKLKQWQLNGRFAYRAINNGFSAAIVWDYQTCQNHINVLGPLGLWRATIQTDATGAQLSLSDGRHLSAVSVETLLQAHLGWSMPVEAMRYWLLCLPQPGVPATIIKDSKGQVLTIKQAGWIIQYQGSLSVSGYRLPQQVVLSKDTVRLKVVIEHWQLQL